MRKILCVLLLALCVHIALALPNQTTVVTFVGPNQAEWVCPPNVKMVLVECWGPGGGTNGNPQSPSGAGGGGAYAASIVKVTPGKKYVIGDFVNRTAFSGLDAVVSAVCGDFVMPGNLKGGKGGQAAKCTGTTKYSGGDGGDTYAPNWDAKMGTTRGSPYSCGEGGAPGSPGGNGANGRNGSVGFPNQTGNGAWYIKPMPNMDGYKNGSAPANGQGAGGTGGNAGGGAGVCRISY